MHPNARESIEHVWGLRLVGGRSIYIGGFCLGPSVFGKVTGKGGAIHGPKHAKAKGPRYNCCFSNKMAEK